MALKRDSSSGVEFHRARLLVEDMQIGARVSQTIIPAGRITQLQIGAEELVGMIMALLLSMKASVM
jgi:hypothetical protein